MASKGEEMILWTRYFDSKLTRSQGRRVPKIASIPNPTLETLVWAARTSGIRKMRQEPDISHPSRPYSNEGRLVMPPKHALEVTNSDSKEGVMQEIGRTLRARMKESQTRGDPVSPRASRGNVRQRSQRKSFKNKSSNKRKSKFGKRK